MQCLAELQRASPLDQSADALQSSSELTVVMTLASPRPSKSVNYTSMDLVHARAWSADALDGCYTLRSGTAGDSKEWLSSE